MKRKNVIFFNLFFILVFFIQVSALIKEITVKGAVVNGNDEPVPKALILLQDTSLSYNQEVLLDSFYTDEDGKFEKKVEVKDNAMVLVAIFLKTDYKTVCTYKVIIGEIIDFEKIIMEKAIKVPVTVTGRIVDESGSPVTGVSLLFTHSTIATSPPDTIYNEQDGKFQYNTEMDTSIITELLGIKVWAIIFYQLKKDDNPSFFS